MLKFKKLFLLGLLTVAVSMFTASCILLDDEYNVSLENGGIGSSGDGLYADGDAVSIRAGSDPLGFKFTEWTTSDEDVTFANPKNRNTSFTMPARDVRIRPWFLSDGYPYVRFTWETVENQNITHVSASEDEIDWWLSDVYADMANSDADFTDIPLYNGNPDVGTVWTNSSNTPGKGKYWQSETGNFTAVCGVQDGYGLAEIVANYTLTINNAMAAMYYPDDGKRWFEIAFDVGTFLSDPDMDDYAWFDEIRDNSYDAPRLVKKTAKMKKFVQKKETDFGSIDITYYVIRRDKK
jgi:hypothetical protein